MYISKYLLICALVCSCGGLNKRFHLQDDNFIEEAVEDVIENSTGFDLDLTPFSEES